MATSDAGVSRRQQLLMLGGLVVGGTAMASVAEAAAAKHPRIQAAITELKSAREYLKVAPHNFGGHRKRAIEAINVSIDELKICLDH